MITPQRLALARELHDGVAQDLVALGYELDLLLAAAGTQAPVRKGIRSLRFQVDELITTQICGARLSRVEIAEFDIEPTLGIEITAIATELLRNCARHSGGNEIEIFLSQVENHTYLEVRDNGVGGATLDSSRLGLIGIKERTEQLGGAFTYLSTNSGTCVAITL